MSEIKFTPGPWKFLFELTPETVETLVVPPNENGEGWESKTIAIGNQKDECLAEVKAYKTTGFLQSFSEWQGNARLIAAAPEMYGLLKTIHSYFNSFSKDWQEGEEMLSININAILNKINQ